MNITREQFKKLAKKHLIALQGYDVNETIEIFGVEKLYDEIVESGIGGVNGSLPSDDRIVAEAIQVVRKVDTEVGLLSSNNDIKMFCLGAKWMRDLAQSNDR